MSYYSTMKIKILEELNIPDVNELFIKENELEDKEKQLKEKENKLKEYETILELKNSELILKETKLNAMETKLNAKKTKLSVDFLELTDKMNKIKDIENNLEPDMPKLMDFNKSPLYAELCRLKQYLQEQFNQDNEKYIQNIEIILSDTTEYIVCKPCNSPTSNSEFGIWITNKGKIYFNTIIHGGQYHPNRYPSMYGDLQIKMNPTIVKLICTMTKPYTGRELRDLSDYPLYDFLRHYPIKFE